MCLLQRIHSPGTEPCRITHFRTPGLPHFRIPGLPHFRTFALSHFRTFALSHFRTFALSHFRTSALSHFLPYLPRSSAIHARTFPSSTVSGIEPLPRTTS